MWCHSNGMRSVNREIDLNWLSLSHNTDCVQVSSHLHFCHSFIKYNVTCGQKERKREWADNYDPLWAGSQRLWAELNDTGNGSWMDSYLFALSQFANFRLHMTCLWGQFVAHTESVLMSQSQNTWETSWKSSIKRHTSCWVGTSFLQSSSIICLLCLSPI